MNVHLVDSTKKHFYFDSDDVKCVIDSDRIDIQYCTIYLKDGVMFDVFLKVEEVISALEQ